MCISSFIYININIYMLLYIFILFVPSQKHIFKGKSGEDHYKMRDFRTMAIA